jgi:hypothetical protein
LQNEITPSVAQSLHMRAVRISQAAERAAAVDHGSSGWPQQLLRRLDDLDQTLWSIPGRFPDTGPRNNRNLSELKSHSAARQDAPAIPQ